MGIDRDLLADAPARWRVLGADVAGAWQDDLVTTIGGPGRRLRWLPWRWQAYEAQQVSGILDADWSQPPAVLQDGGSPKRLRHGGSDLRQRSLAWRRGVADLARDFGGAGQGRLAWLQAVMDIRQRFTGLLHFTADWRMRWWCDGTLIVDTSASGNGGPCPTWWHDHAVELDPGRHVLVGCIVAGAGGWKAGCRASIGSEPDHGGIAIEAERPLVVPRRPSLAGLVLHLPQDHRPLLNGTALPPGRRVVLQPGGLQSGVNRLLWRWHGRTATSALAALGLPADMSSAGRRPIAPTLRAEAVPIGAASIRAVSVGCSGPSSCGVTCRTDVVASVELRLGDRCLRSGPGTTHCFLVEGLAAGRWHAATLRTGRSTVPIRLRAIAGEQVRLGLLSDPSPCPDILRRAARRLAACRPEAVAMLGDLVADGDDDVDWDEQVDGPARCLLRRLPVYAIPGNHDAGLDLNRLLCRVGSGPHWSARLGPVALIALDGSQRWRRSGPDLDWLEWALDVHAEAPHVVVLNHYPAWTSTPHGTAGIDGRPRDPRVAAAREVIWPLLARRRVSLYLCGHAHCYEESRPPVGPPHLTIGGAGGYLYRRTPGLNPYSRSFISAHHVAVIDADMHWLRLRAIGLDGRILARMRLRSVSGG